MKVPFNMLNPSENAFTLIPVTDASSDVTLPGDAELIQGCRQRLADEPVGEFTFAVNVGEALIAAHE